MSEIRGLLQRWVRSRLGDEAPGAEQRLSAYRVLAPGALPDDYAEALLCFRSLASLHNNQVLSVEPPPRRRSGVLGYIEPNPAVALLFGLQRSYSNVFEALADTGSLLPPSLVAIGRNDFGDLVCLDVGADGKGRTYHWWLDGDRTPADSQGTPGWNNIFLLAHSFTDLLRRMRPAPDLARLGELSGDRAVDAAKAAKAMSANDPRRFPTAGAAEDWFRAEGLTSYYASDTLLQFVPAALTKNL